jgi:hypothetical protein
MSIRSSLSFIERLWPRHRAHATPTPRERLLYALIVVAIMLAAGPELCAAIDLTLLLELLGASLFLTAFAAGARLIVTSFLRAAYDLVVPRLARFVLCSETSVPVKVYAAVYIAFNALWWIAIASVCGAFGKAMAVFVA